MLFRSTDQMEAAFYAYDERVKKMGGVVKALDNAFFQREIAEASFKYQRALENKTKFQVGVNVFNRGMPTDIELLKIDQAMEDKQIARVAAFKSKRSAPAANNALAELRKACDSTENLMPLILGAVKAHATLGEVVDTMREAFGIYNEKIFL